MGNRKDRDLTFQPDEDNVIREIVDRQLSDIPVGNAGHERSGFGKSLQVAERLPDLRHKSSSDFRAALAVPRRCLTQLPPGTRA